MKTDLQKPQMSTSLHRIVMNVIEVAFEIIVLFQRMFPESRLPDTEAADTTFDGAIGADGWNNCVVAYAAP